ncbi:PREDICTED: fibulin-1-like isoform X1 [Branchiostoma belcheri]|uniref:Fibulin-1-like isoform X1 n=1 Tax=Branchiostoma belcheri TaxID=7741 RepID=A0A6P5A5T7_BRABE|nr:PREDICTED: fibulin-1-like isoform X1 [Branchiostoma belcheri]
MKSSPRLLILSLVLLTAVTVLAKKRKKDPTCDAKNIPNTSRVCRLNGVIVTPSVRGEFIKLTECTWNCNLGCKWVGGPKKRTCKGRPGEWKKQQRSNGQYQKSKGIQCACRSCTGGPGDWPGVGASADCTSGPPYGAGTLCNYPCGPGYTTGSGNRQRLCFNSIWRDHVSDLVCTDIDECAADIDNCAQVCTNTDGSYTCGCNPGYVLNADGVSCDDVDECAADTDNCEQTCTNTVGSFTCGCNDGYVLNADGFSCDDVDECLDNNGGCAHDCDNTVGSFTCSCLAGFILADDGLNCDPEPTGEMPTVMPTDSP